jgi:hypothetical protein
MAAKNAAMPSRLAPLAREAANPPPSATADVQPRLAGEPDQPGVQEARTVGAEVRQHRRPGRQQRLGLALHHREAGQLDRRHHHCLLARLR